MAKKKYRFVSEYIFLSLRGNVCHFLAIFLCFPSYLRLILLSLAFSFFRDEPRKCEIFNSKKMKILITVYIQMYCSKRGNRRECRYFLMGFFFLFNRRVCNKFLFLNKVKIFITKYQYSIRFTSLI